MCQIIEARQSGSAYAIHSDASCCINTNTAAGAYIIIDLFKGQLYQNDVVLPNDIKGSSQAELQTILQALNNLRTIVNTNKKIKVKIYTDSKYAISYIQSCIDILQNKKITKPTVDIDTITQDDLNLVKTFRIKLEHEKGHADNVFNSLCDTRAKNLRKSILKKQRRLNIQSQEA